MAFHVFQTEQFRRDIEHHAESRGAVARLVEKIERDQSITHLDQFLPSPFLKKKLGAIRVVVEERLLDEHTLLVFARLMFRGDKTYEAFVRAPDSIRSTYAYSEEDLRAATASASVPSRVMPLEEHERAWLWSVSSEEYDEVVLESADWVDRMRQSAYLPWRAKIHGLVERACSRDATGDHLADASGDVRILFNRSADGRRLILVAPILKEDAAQETLLRQRNDDLLSAEAGALDYTAILRKARRAYPSLVLADTNIWLRIQGSTSANLALSPAARALSANVGETAAREKFSVEGEQAKAARERIIESTPQLPAVPHGSDVQGHAAAIYRRVQEEDRALWSAVPGGSSSINLSTVVVLATSSRFFWKSHTSFKNESNAVAMSAMAPIANDV